MRAIWRDYGLSLTLAVLFLGSLALQTWTGWVEHVSKQRADGLPAEAFGPDGYVWSWAQATFENWQSEFLQVFVFILLTTFLLHRGSHESTDSDEAMMARLGRIEQRLVSLSQQPTGQRPQLRAGRQPGPAPLAAILPASTSYPPRPGMSTGQGPASSAVPTAATTRPR